MTDSEAFAPPAEPAPPAERRMSWAAVLTVGGAVAAAGAALGALGGWLWYRWWGPPNKGSIYDTVHGPKWYDLTDKGIAHEFNGPAEYAVVALGLGILLGVVAALVARRRALAVVGGLIVGSALAAYLSWAIGTAMSPPDPQEKYATKANVCEQAPCKEYPAAIEISGWTPLLCWPLGALGAFSVTVVASSWIEDFRRAQASQKDAGNWLAAPGAPREQE